MKENLILHYDEIPTEWAYCFNEGCGRRAECLRHVAGGALVEQAPEGHLKETCVTPLAWTDGDCRMFCAVRTERVAWGFDSLFAPVLQKDFAELKSRMTEYLRGRSNFYRYRSGELKLRERQQQWVAELFRSFGYAEPVAFDHYAEQIVFSDHYRGGAK